MIDNPQRFWWFDGVKFLPALRPVALVSVLALSACATAANRRELYNTSEPNGPWHDYERRREAEAAVGLAPGSSSVTTATTAPAEAPHSGRTTPQPHSAPLPTDVTIPPSGMPPLPAPAAAPPAPPADAGAPATPAIGAPAATVPGIDTNTAPPTPQ